ncbi:hypothetical protein BUALT_Bualt03G0211000 [Buddleja alternifolia]|uniref:DUF674 family protein n=1 Tax=Buddleja alternifolia TaxID=168488 RepID=A0AAV6XX96_9LAMI|nr:hypothetical protein BUALT_Bualt03G0211000 [Buddleja alternifolia]
MSTVEEVKFSLKVIIDKQKTKVLFAEVSSDFADVLLSFMTFPLGKIVRILEKHYGDEAVPALGSLNSLRKSLTKLNDVHFWTKQGKMMLLNPVNPFEAECHKLKLNIDHDALPTKYFTCEDWNCSWSRYKNLTTSYDIHICCCGKPLNREIGITQSNQRADCQVFTRNTTSFLISDDLKMMPNVTGSIMHSLSILGITDVDGAELRTVTVGFNEIMNLLKGSLFSRTPLTNLILSERPQQIDSYAAKSEPGSLLHRMVKEVINSNSKKMIMKVMIQKSTNKLLFAQSEDDFIDFIFSFLTIPLGAVVHLLDGNTCLKNIDNLYRSIVNINGDKYLKSEDTKNRLLKPELPPKFLSKNQIFSLTETKLYYYKYNYQGMEYISLDATRRYDLVQFQHPNEMELEIGLEEGLSILRASLTSTSALTNGLKNNPILMKQPKEEH